MGKMSAMNETPRVRRDGTCLVCLSVLCRRGVDQGANWALHPSTFLPPRQNRPSSVPSPLIVGRVTRRIIAFCSSAAATVFGEWGMDSGGERKEKRGGDRRTSFRGEYEEVGVGWGRGYQQLQRARERRREVVRRSRLGLITRG